MKPRYPNTIQGLIACAFITVSQSTVQAVEVNAVATGAWTDAATWSDSAPAAAGNDYTIDGFTVTSPTGENTVTFPGDSITIAKTGVTAGVLDLARLHASGEQIITTTLPPVTINDGATLQFRAQIGSNRWNLGSGVSINASGSVLFNNAGGAFSQNINLAGPISGTGLIEYRTPNAASSAGNVRNLTLSGANSAYTGDWLVNAIGTTDDFARITVNAANALGSGTVTIGAQGQLFNNAGNGFDSLAGITLDQAASTVFFNSRDWSNAAGVLTINDGTANVGTAHLDIASATQSAGTINLTVGGAKDGKIITSGDADFAGGSINFDFAGSPVGKTFDLVTYGGSLIAPPFVELGDIGRLTPLVNNGSGTNDKITLSFTGSVANLKWTGDEPGFENDWDNDLAINFDNNGTQDKFRKFDHVTFENTTGSTTPNLIGTLSPSSVTFSHPTNDYTLGGSGNLSGATGITKSGTGTLTIANTSANTFMGDITVNGGTLKAGMPTALGAVVVGTSTIINTGATLDVNGQNLGSELIRISGGGVGSNGAIINSGAQQLNALRFVTLEDDASIGGSVRWDIRGATTAPATLDLVGHKLTKTGINYLSLVDANVTSGDIDVNQGTLALARSTLLGTGTATVNGGGILEISSGTIAANVTRDIVLNGGSITTAGAASGANSNITLTADSVIGGAGTLTLNGAISEFGGAYGITKSGTHALMLSGDNAYTGGTTITLGQVNVTSDTAFGTGTVEFQHSTGAGTITRANLVDVNMANDFILNTNAATGFRGPIHAGTGNTLSILSGTIEVQANVGNGGHFSSLNNGVLRLTGTLNTTGPVPSIRSGVVEMGTTGGNLTQLGQGEGTLRLIAHDGIQSTVRLNLAVSLPGILDLNGFNQTLAELRRHTTHAATVTNGAATPSVITIDGSEDHAFNGTINNGSGGISLVKGGSSTFTLSGANTYLGDTTVNAGTLELTTAYLADSSAVRVTTGATLALPHGQPDTIDALFIDGVQQAAGTYDSDNTTFITGTGSLVVTSGPSGDPFATWASAIGLDGTPGKEAGFDDDPDGDGIANGLEWILGGNPLNGQSGDLVTATATGSGGLTLAFTRNEDSVGIAALEVEYSATLAAPWTSATIGATTSGPDANGVTVTIDTAPTPDTVTVNIPASNAPAGKLFGRLKATQP